MATVQILTIPIGSQYIQNINPDNDDPEDRNDFKILLIFDSNVTGLTTAGFTLSFASGTYTASVIELTGENSVWMATIRPPQAHSGSPNYLLATSAVLTVTLAADAVTEGLTGTLSTTIRISRSFPDTDAQALTKVCDLPSGYIYYGIAVQKDAFLITNTHANGSLVRYSRAGTLIETLDTNAANYQNKISLFNDTLLVSDTYSRRIHLDRNFSFDSLPFYRFSRFLIPTSRGILGYHSGASVNFVALLPFAKVASTDSDDLIDVEMTQNYLAACTANDVIFFKTNRNLFVTRLTGPPETSSIQLIHLRDLNVNMIGTSVVDIDIFGETLYAINDGSNEIFTLDITHYLPVQDKTKFTIYPVFAGTGDTIDLTPYSPNAKRITFDVGFDKPSWLSINANNQLTIGNTAAVFGTGTKTVQPCLVKLKAFNYLDSTETGSFQFYLVVMKTVAPTWKDVSNLTMPINSTYDLFQLVPDADSITFEIGETQPTGASISDGIFTIGTTEGTVYFTATKGGLSTDIAIDINILAIDTPDNYSDVFRYKVEIAGIDVTPDLITDRSLRFAKNLDNVELTKYRAHTVILSLQDIDGKYATETGPNSFWTAHNLNPGGYQETVTIYLESFVNGTWISTLAFVGILMAHADRISAVQTDIRVIDISINLEQLQITDIGTLSKWATFHPQSDEATFETVYAPETSLLPMQVSENAKAYNDRTQITIQKLQNPTHGKSLVDTGYLTPSDFRKSGDFFKTPPLFNFKAIPRAQTAQSLINQIATNQQIYNTDIALPEISTETPTFFNHGSIAFEVENTRITRIPVDWTDDPDRERFLILLANPERHINDLIVQYDLKRDTHKILHTLPAEVKAHRIARKDTNTYAILTSKGIERDGSRSPLSNPSKADSYAHDAEWDAANVRILLYQPNQSTPFRTLVDKTDTPKPQLSVQYYVGFENKWTVFYHEGLRSEYRGPFEWKGNYLYYRSVNGVGRVDTTGTTTALVSNGESAFALTSGTTRYMVRMDWESETQAEFGNILREMTITKQIGTQTPTSVFSETKVLGDYEDISPLFGSPMNCPETLEHDDVLYMLVQYRKWDPTHAKDLQITPTIETERVASEYNSQLYIIHSGSNDPGLYPSSTRLNPGDTLPLRINLSFESASVTYDATKLKVTGATVVTQPSHSNSYTVTLRPTSSVYHKPIVLIFEQGAFSHSTRGQTGTVYIFIDVDVWLSTTKTAGLALHACNITNSNPTLRTLKVWDFVHKGGCNLIAHDDDVYFSESPVCANAYKPVDPDVEGYSKAMGYNTGETPASLFKIATKNEDGTDKAFADLEVEELGNFWWQDDIDYPLSATRFLSVEGELHSIRGYGTPSEVLRAQSLAAAPDNFAHIVYGQKLRYILPTVSVAETLYNTLANIGLQTYTTLNFQSQLISLKDRRPYRAKTNGTTGTGTANIAFDTENRAFPTHGYLRIGDEFLQYTGISSGTFTGITRGIARTAVSNHADNTDILYLNAVLSEKDILQMQSDLNIAQHANVIRDSNSTVEVRDAANITRYHEQVYPLDLGLTPNESDWIEHIFEEYLSELKYLSVILTLHLPPLKKSKALQLTQIIGLRYGTSLYAARVEAITDTEDILEVKAKSISVSP